MRWGDVDYKQLQKLRDNLQKLQDMDLDKFCEDVSKELAARLLALVIPRTPVGQYPRSSGKKGGTLRLGAYPCVIAPDTAMRRCYGTDTISERHRHRYEFNNDYREKLTSAGLTLSGLSPDGRLVETVELTDRAFYIGVQFHPEFKSRPNRPHPLFAEFVRASMTEDSNKA